MTVCIGAICGKGKGVVLASDRMVTGSMPPIEFEHTEDKAYLINDRCLTLSAGDALKPIELLPQVARAMSRTSNPTIEEIVEKTKIIYQALRADRAEENFLRPRGITIEAFYSKGIAIFPPSLFEYIDHQFVLFNYGLQLIIAGFDGKSHLYNISNPGVSECLDTIGFHAIGVGALHALQVFIASRYTINCDLNEALNIVFAAKKKAEVAPGVGEQTDMYYIDEGGLIKIEDNILEELKRIYGEVTRPMSEEIKQKSELLNGYIEKIKEESKKKAESMITEEKETKTQ
jgi:20S proteasome alpha/beta subunit